MPLKDFSPSLNLLVIDIDASNTPKVLRDRYDLQVPVMVLRSDDRKHYQELPRVSPRLNAEGLMVWLGKACSKFLYD